MYYEAGVKVKLMWPTRDAGGGPGQAEKERKKRVIGERIGRMALCMTKILTLTPS